MEAQCDPDRLYRLVSDLTDYPAWMLLTHRVEADVRGTDGLAAWNVELRARVGPFARSKRLRMVRTVHDGAARRVRFERVEIDGRRHSDWVLNACVVSAPDASPPDAGQPGSGQPDASQRGSGQPDASQPGSGQHDSRLEMELHYGGALWTGGVMERVLAEQILAGRERLLSLVSQPPD